MLNRNEVFKVSGLTLTRKAGDAVVIGDDVLIHVSEINGDKVRLTINAPREIPVHRSEVWIKVHSK